MSNTNIASLYDFTLQQMAAESYFEGISLADVDELRRRLRLGTNRLGYPDDAGGSNTTLNQGYPGYTRMAGVQADEFMERFAIVHQWSDNPTPNGTRTGAALGPGILANTGLSATLIRKKDDSGNLTNEYTLAVRSTEFRSWATGGDSERDTVGADLNGIASVGFALAQQAALERYYEWLKQGPSPLLPSGAVLNVAGYSLGGHLATVFTEVHRIDADISFGETVTFNGAGRGLYNADAGSLKDMLDFYQAVFSEPRLASADPGNRVANEKRAAAIASIGRPFDSTSIYGDPRHLWAQSATAQRFGLSTSVFANELLTQAPITQVFGLETINNVNVTANSAIHGPTVGVGIESQPLVEGLGGGLGLVSDRLMKFLGGDFGSGHSIALIADSLALQRALNKLAPSFRLEDFIPILMKATNRVQSNGPGANYEVDALENVLDGLRRQLIDPNLAATEYKDGAGGFGDIAKREIYF